MRGSVLEVVYESLDDPRHSLDSELVLIPSRAALLELVRQVGYQVVVLRPGFTDYTGAAAYKNGTRRAFVCAKQTELLSLSVESVPTGENEPEEHASALMDVPSTELVRALAMKVKRRLGVIRPGG
jgi:hypothetical protein